jgi:hypothetical protein
MEKEVFFSQSFLKELLEVVMEELIHHPFFFEV